MIAKFNVGDRVRVIHNDDKGKAGVIVARSTGATGSNPNGKPIFVKGQASGDSQKFCYDVQLDKTNGTKPFDEHDLEIFE